MEPKFQNCHLNNFNIRFCDIFKKVEWLSFAQKLEIGGGCSATHNVHVLRARTAGGGTADSGTAGGGTAGGGTADGGTAGGGKAGGDTADGGTAPRSTAPRSTAPRSTAPKNRTLKCI